MAIKAFRAVLTGALFDLREEGGALRKIFRVWSIK